MIYLPCVSGVVTPMWKEYIKREKDALGVPFLLVLGLLIPPSTMACHVSEEALEMVPALANVQLWMKNPG